MEIPLSYLSNDDNLLNNMLIAVGRALRQMPRLQTLRVELYGGIEDDDFEIHFYLERLSDNERATMSVYFNADVPKELSKQTPSGKVLQVWRDSLMHIAGVSLDVITVEDD